MKKNDVVVKEAGLSIDFSKGAGNGRYRNFACVIYPDSDNTPDNWQDLIADWKIPAFLSPMHEFDLDIQGQPKKAHYHLMIMFEGKKSRDQIRVLFDQIGGVGMEIVNSIRSYARYLCHMDNPEKHQYDPKDLKAFGGADYFGICNLAVDKYNTIGEMMDHVRRERIHSFAELMQYSKENRFDWFRILCDSGAYIMKEYIKSIAWEDNPNYLEDGMQA